MDFNFKRRTASEERRTSVRFSETVECEVFDPDITMDRASLTSESLDLSTAQSHENAENRFRVPFPPAPKQDRRVRRADAQPLHSTQREGPTSQETQPTGKEMIRINISPGTNANTSKFEAKMKRLAEKQKKDRETRARHANQQTVAAPEKVDITLTELSFLGTSQPVQSQPPPPRFSDISMIHPSDQTFLPGTPCKQASGVESAPMCSTPFLRPQLPSQRMKSTVESGTETRTRPISPPCATDFAPQDVSVLHENYEEKMERQMRALAVWCNMILRSDNEHKDLELGSSRQEADKKLQDLLTKAPGRIAIANAEATKKFTYGDFLKAQARNEMREKAAQFFAASPIPAKIRSMMEKDVLGIRDQCSVYANICNQKTMLRVFLSFHPAWLHLGLETVFGEEIRVEEGQSFIGVISRFISSRLFTDPAIMKNRKFAVGTVKMTVTPLGREALHRHFLTKACLFFFFVETAREHGMMPYCPRLFNRGSPFKSMAEVFTEMSREVLSASGMTIGKAFAKIGFKPAFKQGFFDDFDYVVDSFSSLSDGVVLGRLVELVCDSRVAGLREPRGDRLRKVGNVAAVLAAAEKGNVPTGDLRPEAIVGCNREAILGLMWRLVGVYVLSSEGKELRRESLVLANRRDSGFNVAPTTVSGNDFLVHICRQIGQLVGVNVNDLADLRDGALFAGAWRLYNPHAPDVHFFPGKNLYQKIVNAAESELGVPIGLQGATELFAHIYLSRLFAVNRQHSAATRIQRSFRAKRFLRMIKECLQMARSQGIVPHHQLPATGDTEATSRPAPFRNDVISRLSTADPRNDVISRLSTAEVSSMDQHTYIVFERVGDDNADGRLPVCPGSEHSADVLTNCGEGETEDSEVADSQTVGVNEGGVSSAESDLHVERVVGHPADLTSEEHDERLVKGLEALQRVLRINAATKIQCWYRCGLARKALERRRQSVMEEAQREEAERQREEEERLRQLEEDERRRQLEEDERRRQLEEEERRRHAEEEEKRRQFEEDERRRQLEEDERRMEQEAERRREEEERLRQLEEEERIRQLEEEERLRQLEEDRRRQEEEDERLRRLEEEERFRMLKEEERRRHLEEEERLRQLEEERRRTQLEEEERRLKAETARRLEEEMARKQLENRAATIIQCAYRIFVARREFAHRREESTQREKAAIRIQCAYRVFVARREFAHRREESARREVAAIRIQRFVRQRKARLLVQLLQQEAVRRLHAVTVIQKYVRGFSARRQLPVLLEDRRKFIDNVITIQAHVRGYLARRQLAANIRQLAQREEQPVAAEQSTQQPVQKISIRGLFNEVRRLKAQQNSLASLLQRLQRQRPSKERQTAAAVSIQSWWRGVRVRRSLVAAVAARNDVMLEYVGRMVEQEGAVPDIAEARKPAFERLSIWGARLFSTITTDALISAQGIDRLTALSPLLLHEFICNQRGLDIWLDRMESLDRGPAMTEIAAVLVQIMQRILESEDPRIIAATEPHVKDLVKVCFHTSHAYHKLMSIVCPSVQSLLYLWSRPAARPFFDRASFYLSQAEKRMGRLPPTDARLVLTNRLRQAIQQNVQ